MSSLTAVIAFMIDEDQGELEWVLERVRQANSRWSAPTEEERQAEIRGDVADELRKHVAGADILPRMSSTDPVYTYVFVAMSYMYTHVDWQTLAQYYINKTE